MNRYIDAEKLIAEIKRRKVILDKYKDSFETAACCKQELEWMEDFISSLQQEQPEENKLPNKRTRVNYAICKLQSFKPLRETIVLDDYVYDEGKCYRENLLNYIHAIPENRLTEIRSYLKEKGWWPYDDDDDWMDQEQPEVDLEKEIKKYKEHYILVKEKGFSLDWMDIETTARHFYELGLNAKSNSYV